MWIIACGNAFDGLTLYGPFTVYADAEAALESIEDTDAHIVELAPWED